MDESTGLWKQRYEFALEAAKRAEQEHKALVAQLGRALVQVSHGCEGQDAALDAELEGLRAFLRMKTVSTDVLASKIDVVEERVRALRRERAGGTDPAIAKALEELLDALGTATAPRDRQRAVDTLRKDLRSRGEAASVLSRAVALLPPGASPDDADASRSRASYTTGSRAATEAQTGLLRRLFGGGARDTASPSPPGPAAQATTPESEGALEQVFEPLVNPASKALDALIDTVPAPAAEPALRRIYELAKQRLARGVRWQELVPSIEEIRVLASAALERGRDEFGLFLRQMNERLAEGAGALQQGSAQTQARADNVAEFSSGVQSGLQSLRERAEAARDLEELKREVSQRVEESGKLIARFREREEQLIRDATAAAGVLSAQVWKLSEQAVLAEARIEEERRVALTDPLTQLPNREAWTRRAAEEYERWRRYARELSMAVCDIDRFKNVNDTYGHAGGDAVLAAVAATLRETLRESDFVARYGGEEFVILMPETTPLDAAQALEHVRREIARRSIRCGDRSLQVTASFGVAGFGDGDEPDRVFARADAALYRAKHSGRDRVAVYSDEDAERE